MATTGWTITPGAGSPEIDETVVTENNEFKVTYPLNSGSTDYTYIISYLHKEGCTTITKEITQRHGDACRVRVKSTNLIGGTVTWMVTYNGKETAVEIDGGEIGSDGYSQEKTFYCVGQIKVKVTKDGEEYTGKDEGVVECDDIEYVVNKPETCVFTVETCYDTKKYNGTVKWYTGRERTEEQFITATTEYESCFNEKLCFTLTSQTLTEVYAYIEAQLKTDPSITLRFDSNNGEKIECNGINQISSIKHNIPSLALNLSCENIPIGASLRTGQMGVSAKEISLGTMTFNSPYRCDNCSPVPTDSVEVKFKLDIDGQTGKYSFSMYDINVEDNDISKINDPLNGTINTSGAKDVYCLKDDATPNLDKSAPNTEAVYLRYRPVGGEFIPITLYCVSGIGGGNTMTYIYKGTGAYEDVSLAAQLAMTYGNVGLILTFEGFSNL